MLAIDISIAIAICNINSYSYTCMHSRLVYKEELSIGTETENRREHYIANGVVS